MEVLFALEPRAPQVTRPEGMIARRHSTGRAMQENHKVLYAPETLTQAWIWGRGLLNPGEDSDHHPHLTDGESELS